jgi:putative transposase
MDEYYYNNEYRIKTTRLKHYNYSQNGYYFVTICTKDEKKYFGDVENEKMVLNKIGEIVRQYWKEIPKHFGFIDIDEFVVMPNHMHGIIIINDNPRKKDAINRVSTFSGGITGVKNPMLSESLSRIVRWFKGRCSFEIGKMYDKSFFKWQTLFYDRIIRDEKELYNIRQYIVNNPIKWQYDEYHN